MLCVAFPCLDIASAGSQAGLAGERSGLFKHVLKILAMAKDCHFVFLENVNNMIGKDMKVVLLEIIRWLVVLGLSTYPLLC